MNINVESNGRQCIGPSNINKRGVLYEGPIRHRMTYVKGGSYQNDTYFIRCQVEQCRYGERQDSV